MIEGRFNLAGYPVPTGHGGRRKQEPWMRDVRVGDVLVSGRGDERVVRDAHFYKNGDLCSVTFAIRHCSWTGRCTTTLNFTDLRTRGFRPKGIRISLESSMDRRIVHDIVHHDKEDQILDCCDVKGVP